MTRARAKHDRTGFTVVEVMVVCILMTVLALLMAAVWSGLGRPLVDTLASGRIAQEANLASEALARDFGGNLAGGAARPGYLAHGAVVGRMEIEGSLLRLCFDGGVVANGLADWADPDTVISYAVENGNLVRTDELAGTTFTVARNVQQMQLTDEGNGLQIQLTFAYRRLTRTYTLVGLDP